MRVSRPVPAVVRMVLKDPRNSADELIGLSPTMYQEGFIFAEPRELRRVPETPEVLELICTFVDATAARTWQKNDRIKSLFGPMLRDLLVGPPKVVKCRDVIADYDDIMTCCCRKPSSYILDGPRTSYDGALLSGECRNRIPEYSIPRELEVQEWGHLFTLIFEIWIASGTLEKWAEVQLSDPKSDLNVAARKLVAKISKHYGVPAYYLIMPPYDAGVQESCPNCGSRGHDSPWGAHMRVCKRCKLAFG